MADKDIWIQLDNASGENKNNTLFGLCALMTHRRLVRSIQVSFLERGHTHEDVDQEHGSLSRWISRHLREASSIDHVVQSVQGFLDKRSRQYEPLRLAFRCNQVREYKHWLRAMPYHLQGIGGPGAAHTFRFERVEGYVDHALSQMLSAA